MIELMPFLKKLLSLPGLSAYEAPVREVIAETWQPLVDKLVVSRVGSLHGLKRGVAPEPRPRLLLAAHMDAVGLMVSGIVGGFLRITEVGGVDDRILPGQLVTVHGKRELPGVVVQPPDFLLPLEQRGKAVRREFLLVDVGLTPDEVGKLIRVGDPVSFAQQPFELPGEALVGHSLDNRASVAALTVCLDELQHMVCGWDVWAVATAQEEETFLGAYTSPFDIRPNMALVVDVTHAKGPGGNGYRTYGLGKGVVLGWGPNIHPGLHKAIKELAERLEVPFQIEPMPRHSGTDAYAIQITAEGIPCMVLSIPLRYMHTPVELVSLKDIYRTGHLLAEFIARLKPDFMQEVTWEEPS